MSIGNVFVFLHADGYFETFKVNISNSNATVECLHEGHGPCMGTPAQYIVGHLVYYFSLNNVYSYNPKTHVWSTYANLAKSFVTYETPVYYQSKSFLIYNKPTKGKSSLKINETYPYPNIR